MKHTEVNTSDDERYEPVDCSFHDRLVSWATLRQPVHVTYVDENGEKKSTENTIADVYTKNKAEYVQLNDGTTIRLDKLVRVDE